MDHSAIAEMIYEQLSNDGIAYDGLTHEDGEYEHLKDDDGISSIGKKVMYCRSCETAEFEGHEITEIKTSSGRGVKHCPFCGDALGTIREDRISHREVTLLMVPRKAPRSTVERTFHSTWGNVSLFVSVWSFFAPQVKVNDIPAFGGHGVLRTLGGRVGYEKAKLKPEDEQEAIAQRGRNIVAGKVARVIKHLVDSGFDETSRSFAFSNLSGGTAQVAAFIRWLRYEVGKIHGDPFAVEKLDLGVAG